MNETPSIGAIIKQLRKERKLTQEELAEQLNITSQAVSRWEAGVGLPDISQIVPLAHAFGVSADVLFGMSDNNDEEVARIIEEIDAPLSQFAGTQEERQRLYRQAYEAYQEALKLHPNNIKLLLSALGVGENVASGYAKEDEEKANQIRTECIREANLILNYSKDIDTVLSTRMWLVHIYSNMKQFDNAEKEVEKFPHSINLTRGIQRAWVLRDKGETDKEIKELCWVNSALLNQISYTSWILGNAYFKKGQYEDAYRVYRVIPDMIEVIYGSAEHTAPLIDGSDLWADAAKCCIKLGRFDEALDWLKKMYAHVTNNARCYNREFHVETPLLRPNEYKWSGDMYVAKDTLLLHLNWKDLDPIRETEGFRALYAKVRALEY